jgi:ubiquinone/menaquinone biosynthesis C-methylase UbiE
METEEQLAWRRSRRALFDTVAEDYDAVRPSYPDEIVGFVVATAGIGPGDPVLEIGCGTGQLTRQLASIGVALTAIDLGASMVALARRNLAAARADVRFAVTAFEDFAAPDASFRLVASATAFHWINPDVGWAKVARLLRPGGWLALLRTGERYDPPVGPGLREVWMRHSRQRRWVPDDQPTFAQQIAATGLFDAAVVREHREHRTLAAADVVTLEHTRATSLGYAPDVRAAFGADLRALLAATPEVGLEQYTELAMARLADRRGER